MRLRVERELRKFWLQGPAEGRVILAISGGVDSMVLLEGMSRVARRDRLLVVHVNHGLRGAESDGDERLVLERSRELGIEARAFRLEWSEEAASQDACRRRREEIFRSLCVAPGDRVWLAHHLNDQAETVFFRLLRGTGARGLRGMLPLNGRKVRPFLSLEKSELRAAALEWGVRWREDSSNRDAEAYERNWIRGFFPLLEERRPGFQKKLAALAEEARGWKFVEEPGLDCFEAGKGILFARGAAASPRVLAETFRLSRLHAGELAELLRKPAGKLEAEGAKFTWSAGVLLRESGVRFSAGLSRSGEVLVSPLGRWELPKSFADWDKGESRKKEFQSLRVPGFFRDGVPLVSHQGRPFALLPKRLERVTGVRYTPSPLAQWWLSERLEDRPRGRSSTNHLNK